MPEFINFQENYSWLDGISKPIVRMWAQQNMKGKNSTVQHRKGKKHSFE